MLRRLAPLLLVALLLAQTGASLAAADADRAIVILISLDGTRPADVREETLPSLVALAERGARARLVPVFPTNTFPSHVSLVTGVAPERHGLVNNSFLDRERGVFTKDADDIPAWIEVEPLWSLLERRGIVTASYHWVGSEGAWPGGTASRYWKPFSSSTPEREKVEQILAWLDLPDRDARPRFITAWFHGADHMGHIHGPGTPQVVEQLRSQDPAIAALAAGIEARGLWERTTLIFVSDHGMADPPKRLDLRRALRAAGIDARVEGTGGFASVYLQDDTAPAQAASVARERGLEAWVRDEAPAELRVGNPRFGDVVVLAPPDVALFAQGVFAPKLAGFHGYRPGEPSMAAILVAAGRGVGRGVRLPRQSALDVAPTVLALLGVPVPAWMEGRPIEALLPATPSAQPAEAGRSAGESERAGEGARP